MGGHGVLSHGILLRRHVCKHVGARWLLSSFDAAASRARCSTATAPSAVNRSDAAGLGARIGGGDLNSSRRRALGARAASRWLDPGVGVADGVGAGDVVADSAKGRSVSAEMGRAMLHAASNRFWETAEQRADDAPAQVAGGAWRGAGHRRRQNRKRRWGARGEWRPVTTT